jgi:hypothetical protein
VTQVPILLIADSITLRLLLVILPIIVLMHLLVVVMFV